MEEFVLSRWLNSQSLMEAVFLAGLFAVVVFKKESIAIPGMFKLAYICFALAIVVPACMTPFAALFRGALSGRMGARTASDVDWTLNLIYSAAGPSLFALSVLCAFSSLFPRKVRTVAPSVPAKHPLD